jgi:hypothetical protein
MSSAAIDGRLDIMTGANGGADSGARPGGGGMAAMSFVGARPAAGSVRGAGQAMMRSTTTVEPTPVNGLVTASGKGLM